MKWILIGHRGVGKTQLLERLEVYFKGNSELVFIDLDEQIELKYKKPIFELFPQIGELEFRKIEKKIFDSLLKQHPSFVISVGAGFSCEKLAELKKNGGGTDINILWLRRKTDILGRIFLDRPRLDSSLSALEEFHQRYSKRQNSYKEIATDVFWIPEGLRTANKLEQEILTSSKLETSGILTLLPWHLKEFRFLRYNCDFYEWRDDLLARHSKQWERIPFEKRLLSFRDEKSIQKSLKDLEKFSFSDWGLELGSCPSRDIQMVSAHQMIAGESLSQFLLRLERSASPDQHLKASPLIETYSQATELIDWQAQAPRQRSILPRYNLKFEGRWMWLRLYLKGRQKVNFWRDSDGSSDEQPTLFEWMNTPRETKRFAALLGDPVFHSRTMAEQSEFFLEKFNAPVWPILLADEEFESAFQVLKDKGLIAAAVTSPLKKSAFRFAQLKSPEAIELEAANTLFIRQEKGTCHNTDLVGFAKLIEKSKIDQKNAVVAVWGGGGTLSVIKKILPQVIEISVRTRKPREAHITLPRSVDVLIWAAGPRDEAPQDIDFEVLIDLNYREDSRARELAVSKQKKYIAGDEMFLAQAEAQREFWTSEIEV